MRHHDGTATSFYDYDDSQSGRGPSLALIQFWFTSDARFASAVVANMVMPACWATDGGL